MKSKSSRSYIKPPPPKQQSWGGDTSFYRTKGWKQRAKQHKAKRPLCTECENAGITRLGDVVDHIKPIKQGGDKWASENLQTLCHPHHNLKTANENINK